MLERAVATSNHLNQVGSIGGPFVPASADQPLDVGLRRQLQDASRPQHAENSPSPAFCRSSFSGSLSSVIVVLWSV